MWDRALLKQNAKAAFKRNYWWAVLWAVVFVLLSLSYSSSGSSGSDSDFSYSVSIGLSAAAGAISLLMIAVRIVVGGPFRIGYSRWLLNCSEGNPQPSDIGYFFRGEQMGRNIVGIFCTDLIIALWTLLLIVPGIVAGYKYRLVPYLMAENPEMTGKEARQRSAELMTGYKMDAFLLDISFIGWFLLGILTLGILDVFYVDPYYYATQCELYRAIRDCSGLNLRDSSGWQNPDPFGPQAQTDWQAGPAAQEPWSETYGQNTDTAPEQPSVPAEENDGRVCPNCGNPVTDTAYYCSNCGAKL